MDMDITCSVVKDEQKHEEIMLLPIEATNLKLGSYLCTKYRRTRVLFSLDIKIIKRHRPSLERRAFPPPGIHAIEAPRKETRDKYGHEYMKKEPALYRHSTPGL